MDALQRQNTIDKMINELNLDEDDKGRNYIKNEGSHLGIIQEDHADDES